MKISHYIEQAEKKEEYHKFKKEHPKSYLCAGFFVLDFESGKDLHQLDFYIPSLKKVASFNINEDKIQIMETKMKEKPEEIKTSEFDLDRIKGLMQDEMKNHTVTGTLSKIIAVLQHFEGQKILNMTGITQGLSIVRMHIDEEGNTLKFEKASMTDFMTFMPGNKAAKEEKE